MKSFQETQLAFAKHLRAPALYPAPAEVDERRVDIYRELIYNNIENFIANVFPVIRSILTDQHWHGMMRDFIHRHKCQTPYFLEISEEFLQYLVQERGVHEGDPVFLLELAHYEWIELALDVSEDNLAEQQCLPIDLMAARPVFSSLAVNLAYQYPVYKIAPNFQPQLPEPTQLIVYRNRTDKVCFVVANTLTQRLLSLLQTQSIRLVDALTIIGGELRHNSMNELASDAQTLIKHLYDLGVISHFD